MESIAGNGIAKITNQPVGDFARWAATSGVQILSGDFNGDGQTDIALVRQDAGWGTVPVAFFSADACVPQDVYIKIEPVLDYSPVNPEEGGAYTYRRDCFRRAGHEDGTISEDEANLKKFTALVYRQYTDATYSTMVPDKLLVSDISEPSVGRRIPSVIYTQPGRRLRIHVLNGDDAPHSLHMHGLQYGIDSDGAYPLGVIDKNGVRSDAICPGESYTYEYDVKPEMTGCWVFHEHYKSLSEMTRVGLIGGMVVRDPGFWTTLTPSPAFAVHSAVLRSGKVILWSGHAELGPNYGTLTALYNPATDTYNTVPFTDNDDLFCAGHTFLPDGRLIAGGGANPGQVNSTHLFDPITETWSHVPTGDMNNYRWYPTMVAMNDGRTAILSGTPGGGIVADIEVIDMSAPTPGWQTVTGGNKPFSGLYPGFHWLPSGGRSRPTITTAPTSGSYGATVNVDTPDATNIASVCLIAPGAATHHTDTHQRYIKIGFSQTAPTQIGVEIPSNNNVAPPGYYMLFLVDSAGAPSIGHFIQVS